MLLRWSQSSQNCGMRVPAVRECGPAGPPRPGERERDLSLFLRRRRSKQAAPGQSPILLPWVSRPPSLFFPWPQLQPPRAPKLKHDDGTSTSIEISSQKKHLLHKKLTGLRSGEHDRRHGGEERGTDGAARRGSGRRSGSSAHGRACRDGSASVGGGGELHSCKRLESRRRIGKEERQEHRLLCFENTFSLSASLSFFLSLSPLSGFKKRAAGGESGCGCASGVWGAAIG